ncbi:hypothetical protein ACQEU6_28215 [Spirillospora sp. CA-108201]
MAKRIEVPSAPGAHLDDDAYDAIEEANASGEPVTMVYGSAETVVEPGTKLGPAAITARLRDGGGR